MDFIVVHFEQIVFYVLAALTVAGAVGVITLRNPVHAALSLLWSFLMVAALFVLRQAEFLAAVQVLVYAGGIMVLFLFVIMLVNVKGLSAETVFLSRLGPLAIMAGVLVGALLAVALLLGVLATAAAGPGLASVPGETAGNTQAVGMTLYTTYLVPFEVVSVVLLVAMIGAIIFGRRDPEMEGSGEVRL
jgi:NADH-quinone oxidoreductase subunit J